MVSEVKCTKWSWLLMRELLNIPIGCVASPFVSCSFVILILTRRCPLGLGSTSIDLLTLQEGSCQSGRFPTVRLEPRSVSITSGGRISGRNREEEHYQSPTYCHQLSSASRIVPRPQASRFDQEAPQRFRNHGAQKNSHNSKGHRRPGFAKLQHPRNRNRHQDHGKKQSNHGGRLRCRAADSAVLAPLSRIQNQGSQGRPNKASKCDY